MRKIIFLVLLVAVTFSPAFAADVQARQILDSLYGGPGIMPIQDVIIKAEISKAQGQAPGGQALIQMDSRDTIFFKKPNFLRVDAMLVDPGGPHDGQLVSVIRDGTNRWMFVSAGSYPVKKGMDEPSPTLVIPFNLQVYPQHMTMEYVLLGKEMVDGVTCDVIRSVDTANPDKIETVWIDQGRGVPLKLEKNIPPEKGGEAAVLKTVFYKDIKQLSDGRHFPFKLEFNDNNVLTKIIVYTDVEVNTGIQDTLFRPMDKFLK